MSSARNSRLPVLRALGLLGLGGLWAIACGGPQALGAAGSVCFRSDDCQAGLACVPETAGASKHLCGADLTDIVSMVDGAAPDSGEPEATGGTAGAAQGGTPGAGETGAAGKPATGGAPGAAGGGATSVAGAPAAGAGGSASAAGAPAAGAGGSGAGTAGGGTANGGAAAGTGG